MVSSVYSNLIGSETESIYYYLFILSTNPVKSQVTSLAVAVSGLTLDVFQCS